VQVVLRWVQQYQLLNVRLNMISFGQVDTLDSGGSALKVSAITCGSIVDGADDGWF